MPNYAQAPDGSIVGVPWSHTTMREHIPYCDPGTDEVVWDIDIVVTQRWMMEDAVENTKKAQAAGQIVLAEIDDHYWVLPKDNPASKGTDPKCAPMYNRDLYLRQLAVCDGIIASTPTLVEYLSRLGAPVHLCRNMIELNRWNPRDVTVSGNKPRVGWTGNTLYRRGDLMIGSQGAVGPFIGDHDLEFAHVGWMDGTPEAYVYLGVPDGHKIIHVGWSSTENYPETIETAKIDIGIVPLVKNSFNSAKSCLKGMEYAAAGIPFVASPLPEYEWFGVGILAKSAKDWRRALEKLLDPEFRAIKAAEGLARVQQEDVRIRGHEYVDLFDSYL